jgi:hypothetical protein
VKLPFSGGEMYKEKRVSSEKLRCVASDIGMDIIADSKFTDEIEVPDNYPDDDHAYSKLHRYMVLQKKSG